MIGIYKYQNKLNGKIYIGQSVDITRRQYNHKSSAFNEKANDYNSQFHQAIRKYGLENFDFEIIAELTS
jgi:group I intron endonuclease